MKVFSFLLTKFILKIKENILVTMKSDVYINFHVVQVPKSKAPSLKQIDKTFFYQMNYL